MLYKPCQNHIEINFCELFHYGRTRVATLLDALSSVWNASSRISWIDDVALVACGAV